MLACHCLFPLDADADSDVPVLFPCHLSSPPRLLQRFKLPLQPCPHICHGNRTLCSVFGPVVHVYRHICSQWLPSVPIVHPQHAARWAVNRQIWWRLHRVNGRFCSGVVYPRANLWQQGVRGVLQLHGDHKRDHQFHHHHLLRSVR